MSDPGPRSVRPAAARAPGRSAPDHPHDPGDPSSEATADDGPSAGAPRRRFPLAAVVLALVVLAAGLSITGAVAASARQSAREREQRDFALGSREAAEALRENLIGYTNRLRNLGSFLANAPSATPEQFRDYLAGDGTFRDLRAVEGLVFVTRVEADDLGAFTARMATVNPSLELHQFVEPPPGTTRYILTTYVAGPVDLQIPLGYDIGPITSVRDLIDRAATTEQAVAASLHDDPQLRWAADVLQYRLLDQLITVDLFIGVPVFGASASGRGTELTGWIGAPIRHFSDLLAGAAPNQRDDIGLELRLDVAAPGTPAGSVTRTAEQRSGAGALADAGLRQEHALEVNGLRFTLTTWRAPAAELPVTVPLLALGGLAASFLAATVAYLRMRTIGNERAVAAELADRAAFQRAIIDSVPEPLVVLDPDGRVVASNRSGARLLSGGDDLGDVAGMGYLDAFDTVPRARTALDQALHRVLGARVETVNLDLPVGNGDARRWYAVRVTPMRGRGGGAVVVHRDVTERKQARDALELRASRDPLTGLLNRSSLKAQLDHVLVVARRRGDLVGALFIDLDRFKPVNDTLGHATGDAVLQAVAARVEAAVRPGDLVGRLGGDEFVVVMAPTDPPSAERAARRVMDALANPIRVDGEDIAQQASVGVAVVDPRAQELDGDDLLERADRAMYRSKERGGAAVTLTVPVVRAPATAAAGDGSGARR